MTQKFYPHNQLDLPKNIHEFRLDLKKRKIVSKVIAFVIIRFTQVQINKAHR